MTDPRATLSALACDDARRALLADQRPPVSQVQDLLVRVGFAMAHPDRQAATAAAIVERHGDDAARWLLDELLAIAQDPTTDVPAVFAARLRGGLLAAAAPSDGRAAGRWPRPAPHAAGAGDRATTAARRAEEAELDPERRRRGIVVARVLGDGADSATVAQELGVPEATVAALAAAELAARGRESRSPGPRLVRDMPEDARRRRDELAALYQALGRRPPAHVTQVLSE